MGNYPDALIAIRQVLRQDPDDEAALPEMLIIGQAIHNPSVEFAALEGLERIGRMPVFVRPMYCRLLLLRKRKQQARRVAEEGLALLPHVRISGKRELRRFFSQLIDAETPGPPTQAGAHIQATARTRTSGGGTLGRRPPGGPGSRCGYYGTEAAGRSPAGTGRRRDGRR